MKSLVKSIINKLRIASFYTKGIYVHPNSFLGDNTSIGKGTCINGPAFIKSMKHAPVEIGKYCAIGFGLKVRPRNHYTGYANLQDKLQRKHKFPSLNAVKGAIVIGHNVWIGDNVILLSGVNVGHGAVLGAGAIVTKNVPPYGIAVGSPARVVKYRFSNDIIEQLNQISWWDWDDSKIARNRKFFETDLSKYPDVDISSILVD